MIKKEISHNKYNELSEEHKQQLKEYAIRKLPDILKNNEKAIRFEIYRYIRSKI